MLVWLVMHATRASIPGLDCPCQPVMSADGPVDPPPTCLCNLTLLPYPQANTALAKAQEEAKGAKIKAADARAAREDAGREVEAAKREAESVQDEYRLVRGSG